MNKAGADSALNFKPSYEEAVLTALKTNAVSLCGGGYDNNGIEFQNFDFTKYSTISFAVTNMHSQGGYADQFRIYINGTTVCNLSGTSSLSGAINVANYGSGCTFKIVGQNPNGYTQNIKFQITDVV